MQGACDWKQRLRPARCELPLGRPHEPGACHVVETVATCSFSEHSRIGLTFAVEVTGSTHRLWRATLKFLASSAWFCVVTLNVGACSTRRDRSFAFVRVSTSYSAGTAGAETILSESCIVP